MFKFKNSYPQSRYLVETQYFASLYYEDFQLMRRNILRLYMLGCQHEMNPERFIFGIF